ncbi:MAG: replication factor C large subunit [Candidatus Aenigmarchaeota archaeon]|nr:replication factor C large subunit [Candidatus Aenigmarchaeota archaeon]
MWCEKYRPKTLKEFVNQKEALEKFLNWIKNWKPGSKAMLFYGPPGTGKTALVQAYAQEKNLEFVEMNASDFRSKTQIEEVFGKSMLQKPLFKKSKIFLIDEIDGIAGREDVGGISAVIKIIKESNYPCVLTANNPYDPKLKILREECILVEFKKIHVFDIEKRLEEICKKEGINIEKEVLRNLAKRAEGDLRAAINDLEVVARGRKKVTLEDLEVLGYRESEVTIFDALKIIFKTQTSLSAKLSISNVDKDPEEIFWWIENNIINEYEKPEEIAKAFDFLSKADLFRQRITLAQNWRFRSYMIDLMTAGVALAKKEIYKKFTKYQYPQRLVILGGTKDLRKEEKELLLKLSKTLHCSIKKIRLEYLPYLKIIFGKNLEKILNSIS